MKGKELVLKEIENAIQCARCVPNINLEIMSKRHALINALEDLLELVLSYKTEEKLLADIKTVEEFDHAFERRRESTDLLHVLNRVLKGENE